MSILNHTQPQMNGGFQGRYLRNLAKAIPGFTGTKHKTLLLQTVLDSLSQGIRILDRDLKLVLFNQRYIELRDYPPGFIQLGMPIEEIVRFNANRSDYGAGDKEEMIRRRIKSCLSKERYQLVRVMPDGTVLASHRDYLPDGGEITTYLDITDLKRAEEEAAKKSALLETTLENMSPGIAVRDADLNLIAFNQQYVDLLDFPPDFIRLGMPFEEIARFKMERGDYGDGDPEELVRERVALRGQMKPDRREITTPRGRILAKRREPLRGGGYVTTFTDITSTVKSEQEATKKAELLQMIMDNVNQGIRILDKDLNLVSYNQKFIELREYPPGFIRLGMPYEEIARFNAERGDGGPGDVEDPVKRSVQSHQRGERFRGKRVMPYGRVLAVNRDYLPDGGQVTTYLDITELQKAEEEIVKKSALLETTFESTSQGIVVYDADLRLTAFNKHYADFNCYPPGFLRLGMPYEEIARFKAERGDHGPGDTEEIVKSRVLGKRRRERVREERTMENGRIYALVRDPMPGGGSVTTHTDVTELKMSEQMLRNRNRELETLYRISEITGAARSLNVALSQIVEQISLDTGFPIVTIEIYDDKRDMMKLGGATGEPPLSDKTPVEAPLEAALSGLVVRTGRPVLESETSSGPLHSDKTSPRPQIQTFVGMPMMSDGNVLGALCLANTEAMQVDDGRLKWLQSLANSVASLIERKWAKQMLREPSSYRKQLRRRFLKHGGQSLGDGALLELVLQPIRPNVNVKALVKELLIQFGGFAEVIAAEPKRLLEVKGMGENTVVALKSVQAAAIRLTRVRVLNRPLLSSWRKLLDYCRASMAHAQKEELRVLFLDQQNVLIADEVQQAGTIDHTPVYPREVIKRALDHGASGIVLAHNHPSGDPTPSESDIEMTLEVRDAGEKLGITLHDHLIIGKRGHASFKSLGLL